MAWQLRVTFDNADRAKVLEELQTYVKETRLIVADARVVQENLVVSEEGEWEVKEDPYVLRLTIEDLGYLMRGWPV